MGHGGRWSFLWAASSFAVLTGVCGAQQPAQAPPLRAKLIQSLDADRLPLGSGLLLKTTEEWHSGDCVLKSGSALHATVTRVDGGGNGKHVRGVALSFKNPCSGQTDPVVWIALLAREEEDKSLAQQFSHSSRFGEWTGIGSSGNTATDHRDMSGQQNAMPSADLGKVDRSNRPAAVAAGQVWRVPHVSLSLAQPELGTLVNSTTQHLRLESGSEFILVKAAEQTGVRRETVVSTVRTEAVRKQVPLHVAPVSACSVPACIYLSSASVRAGEEISPTKTADVLKEKGYKHSKTAKLHALEHGATVSFLGTDQILVTFDSTQLVKREGYDRLEDRPHGVHAVVLERATLHAITTAEWRIQDKSQYLWTMRDGNVLVHEGNSLRRLGAGLREEDSLPLEGAVAFLRLSPDKMHVLLGEMTELHSPEEHEALVKADNRGAEEHVTYVLLDEHLHRLQTIGEASSLALPPVLLNTGVVELRRESAEKWHFLEHDWDGNDIKRFAQVQSSCLPTMETSSPDLLFVQTCNTRDLDARYMFLRDDGRPVLEGSLGWREFTPLLANSGSGKAIAFAVPEGVGNYVRDGIFQPSDVGKETIWVHDPEHGRALMTLTLETPVISAQPIALSDDGSTLAALDEGRLLLYTVTKGAATQR